MAPEQPVCWPPSPPGGLGHEVLVVERTASVGSVAADSDGHLWMPGNDLMGRGGTPSDSADEALGYLNGLTAPGRRDDGVARRAAFTRTAAVVGRWLVSSRIGLEVVKGLPDCRPASDGAKSQGRTLRAKAHRRHDSTTTGPDGCAPHETPKAPVC